MISIRKVIPMFRTPCILAAFLVALVVLPAATLVSVSGIPGLDKAESPEVQEVLKKVWALQKAAPRTAHLKMHGTARGIKLQTEVWLGGGDIVAKTVNPDGTTMVEGMIGDTAFKVYDGKSMPMNAKQKLNQYLHAHPRMAMDMMFRDAKKITFVRGHEYGKKVNELMLHGVSSFGDIEIQFYEDGTIASNLTPMHGGMAKVIIFGEYSDVQGHPVPHVMNTWIVHLDKEGGWSTRAESSHHLIKMVVESAEVNKPIPTEIFTLSHWMPKDK